jgi:hypothetical protein
MSSEVDRWRMDKTAFSVGKVGDDAETRAYWHRQTPLARLEAMELMRQMMYGYDPINDRLQRVLEVTKLQRS